MTQYPQNVFINTLTKKPKAENANPKNISLPYLQYLKIKYMVPIIATPAGVAV